MWDNSSSIFVEKKFRSHQSLVHKIRILWLVVLIISVAFSLIVLSRVLFINFAKTNEILFINICIEITKMMVEPTMSDIFRHINTHQQRMHFICPGILMFVIHFRLIVYHMWWIDMIIKRTKERDIEKRRCNVSTEKFESVIPNTPFLWRR
jgi:hypothetical protein